MTKISEILERFSGLEEYKQLEFLGLLESHIRKLILENISTISSSEILKSERALKKAIEEIMAENDTWIRKCPTPLPSLVGGSRFSSFSTISPKTTTAPFNIDVDNDKSSECKESKNVDFVPITILPLGNSTTQLTPTIGIVLGENTQPQCINESDLNDYYSLLMQFGNINLTDNVDLQNSTSYISQLPDDPSLLFSITQISSPINNSGNVNTNNHFGSIPINAMNAGGYDTNCGFNYSDPTYNTNNHTGYDINNCIGYSINDPTGYNTNQTFPYFDNNLPAAENMDINTLRALFSSPNIPQYPAPMDSSCPLVLPGMPLPMDPTLDNNGILSNDMRVPLQAFPSPPLAFTSPPLETPNPPLPAPNPPKVPYTYERPDLNSSRFFDITLPVSPVSPSSVYLDARTTMPLKVNDDPVNEESLAPFNIDAILEDSDVTKKTDFIGKKKLKMIAKIIGNPFFINKGIWTPDADFLRIHDPFETQTNKKLTVSSNSKFFIIKTPNISDIQLSYLHNTWTSTSRGNKVMNDAYIKANSNANNGSSNSEKEKIKIYLIFSYIKTNCFCGVAEMTSAVNFDTLNPIWQNSQKYGAFDIKWITIKDVPFDEFKCIILKYADDEYRCVTYSRDSQELPFAVGKRVIDIFNFHQYTSSFLDIVEDSESNEHI
ncbi:unnamed protein product [[Candida] boidinii]|uniref:Unnamed protein product n=1 Tax=Candida boidinii TaxID=5477 RepID=A0A9W6WF10_CANBO|nr:hypothetical protein B5S30_g5074 [[Candida] boidinii]GME67586.1 unnamed protein product [[Candida] boidinii]